jgi:adenylosuccinate lyase
MEKIAVEIRGAQRTEVRELAEPFRTGQKGSSAMPHKRNPILAERLSGMTRLLRGYAGVGFENNALWQERDISHSSAERVASPTRPPSPTTCSAPRGASSTVCRWTRNGCSRT